MVTMEATGQQCGTCGRPALLVLYRTDWRGHVSKSPRCATVCDSLAERANRPRGQLDRSLAAMAASSASDEIGGQR